mgnify:CR=1 FL=1
MKSNCLVTGAAGFIGSHVVNGLIDEGHRVIAIDNTSANNENFYWNEKAENFQISILEYDALLPKFNDIDFVFHLAAESRITNAIESPKNTYEVNVIGTENILKASLENKVKRVVFSSTSAVYGLSLPPNIESSKEDCLNPYSISKYTAEKICQFYNNTYSLPVTILRYFNVFGKRAPSNGYYAPVTSIFLRQLKEKKPLTVVGNGQNKRDFIYVGDIVSANLKFCFSKQHQTFNDIFNVGSSTNISVIKLAEIISENIEFLPPRIGEAKTTQANIDKIKSTINWQPTLSIEDYIKKEKQRIL